MSIFHTLATYLSSKHTTFTHQPTKTCCHILILTINMQKQTAQTEIDICECISRLPPEIRNQILDACIPPRALEIEMHWKFDRNTRLQGQMVLKEPYQPALMDAFFQRDVALHSRYGVLISFLFLEGEPGTKPVFFQTETDIILLDLNSLFHFHTTIKSRLCMSSTILSSEHIQHIGFAWRDLFNCCWSTWQDMPHQFKRVFPNLRTINFTFPEGILNGPYSCTYRSHKWWKNDGRSALIEPLPDSTKIAVYLPRHDSLHFMFASLAVTEEEHRERAITWKDARDRLKKHANSPLELQGWILRRG